MRHFIPIVCFSLLGANAEPLPANSPVCDVAVETALCLHNAEKILMPDARPYGMEVHLTFDESRPLDTSGKKNHGSGEVMAAAGIGGVGSSGLFRNNYVYVPSSESFKSADFSYTFFVYLLEDAKSRLDGRIKVVLGTTGSAALVRHQNRMRLYVDGILDSSLVTEGSTKTNDLPLFVGGAPYAENVCDMPMLLDEFRMFSYALGRDHIQAEASIALGGVEPSFLHIGCTNCKYREASYGTHRRTKCVLVCVGTMALHTPVSAAACGVKPVGMLQTSEHGEMLCSPDEDCLDVPSEGRMRDFFSFLDQTASDSHYYAGQRPKKPNSPGNATSTAGLLSKISALEVELEDKEHNLKTLRELREREKLQEERLRKQLQYQMQGELNRTTEKYEQQCRKQQELLSQLQDEKKDMASRYERLAEEMRDLERRFAAKTAELHKQYGRELERQRRALLSGEKMKKQLEEELVAQRTAVQRQMEEAFEVERSQHRQEIRALKESFETELEKERDALAAKHKQQTAKWEAQASDGKKRLQGEIAKAREEEQQRLKEVTAQLLSQLEQQRNKHLQEMQQTEAAAKAKENELTIQMNKEKETAIREATERIKEEMQAETHK
ncbi:uncharacterized protein EMH_0007810 [Eimeria mitis]|uniref:Uncharacterized protein n=1 Tax=Eimeria mitis TaxID=44415 RepID=U6K237_9EIME|nr:uncharacterized protein EMH_0007810 [Eimeria mitis]CDJ31026.1 hypothetical protein, conserved [Eimeria mitis]